MSPAVPNGLSGTEIAKALERAGFGHLSTRGSHAKYRKDDRTVIVPLHCSLAPEPCAPSSARPTGPWTTSPSTSSSPIGLDR